MLGVCWAGLLLLGRPAVAVQEGRWALACPGVCLHLLAVAVVVHQQRAARHQQQVVSRGLPHTPCTVACQVGWDGVGIWV